MSFPSSIPQLSPPNSSHFLLQIHDSNSSSSTREPTRRPPHHFLHHVKHHWYQQRQRQPTSISKGCTSLLSPARPLPDSSSFQYCHHLQLQAHQPTIHHCLSLTKPKQTNCFLCIFHRQRSSHSSKLSSHDSIVSLHPIVQGFFSIQQQRFFSTDHHSHLAIGRTSSSSSEPLIWTSTVSSNLQDQQQCSFFQ